MECYQQYALYDGGPSRWVAHVRLTPELLQRLQTRPQSVAIQLQAAAAKPSSVLTVDAERYEMLSFREDPTVNAVCAFRGDERGGFALHEVGRVHQKLLVQRMLDSTEKDRMKDKHAKSVLESKARSSKLIAAEDLAPARTRQSLAKRMSMVIGGSTAVTRQAMREDSVLVAETAAATPKKRKLPSSLTAEAARELQERIERGSHDEKEQEEGEEVAEEKEEPAVAQPQSSIFSSDSEAEKSSSPKRRRLVRAVSLEEKTGPQVAQPMDDGKAPAAEDKPKVKRQPKKAAKTMTKQAEAAEPIAGDSASLPDRAEPKTPIELTPPSVDLKTNDSEAPVEHKHVAVERPPAKLPPAKLPPLLTTGREQKKRARPRLSRIPDISFLSANVQEICKRVAGHITRTAILDADDYESFAAEYDRLRDDWEQLDKAFSIETILTDGAHFQLPFATEEEEKQRLRKAIEDGEKKRDGMQFLCETMATIHKILASLQASISAYDKKTLTTAQ